MTDKPFEREVKKEMREHNISRKSACKLVKDHMKKGSKQYSKPKGYLKGSRGLLSNPTGLLSNNR